MWSHDHTSFEWDDKKQPGTPVGGTHISMEQLGDELVPKEMARDMLRHNMEEMGSLAEFLPSLYYRENQ